MTQRESEEFENLKSTLTIVWQSSTPPKLDAPFFCWCQKSHQPYVRVHKHRNRANVFMDMPTASGLLDPEGTEQFRQLCTNCGVPDQGEAFRKPVLYDVPLDLVDKFAEQVKAIGLDFCWRNPAASQAIRTNACS